MNKLFERRITLKLTGAHPSGTMAALLSFLPFEQVLMFRRWSMGNCTRLAAFLQRDECVTSSIVRSFRSSVRRGESGGS